MKVPMTPAEMRSVMDQLPKVKPMRGPCAQDHNTLATQASHNRMVKAYDAVLEELRHSSVEQNGLRTAALLSAALLSAALTLLSLLTGESLRRKP